VHETQMRNVCHYLRGDPRRHTAVMC